MGSFAGLYELAHFILGDLPPEWSFLTYIFMCLIGLLLLFVIFSPVVFVYELIGAKK